LSLGSKDAEAAGVAGEDTAGLAAGWGWTGVVVGSLGPLLADFGTAVVLADTIGTGRFGVLAWVTGVQDRDAGVIFTGDGKTPGSGNPGGPIGNTSATASEPGTAAKKGGPIHGVSGALSWRILGAGMPSRSGQDGVGRG